VNDMTRIYGNLRESQRLARHRGEGIPLYDLDVNIQTENNLPMSLLSLILPCLSSHITTFSESIKEDKLGI
jgi:hypothetical protein